MHIHRDTQRAMDPFEVAINAVERGDEFAILMYVMLAFLAISLYANYMQYRDAKCRQNKHEQVIVKVMEFMSELTHSVNELSQHIKTNRINRRG